MSCGRGDSRKNSGGNREDGRQPNKFLYSGRAKTKSDPWSLSNEDEGEFDFAQPDIKPVNASSPGLDLNGVWSIRKNVQVSEPIKKGTALQAGTKSYYSRHGRLEGNTGTCIDGAITPKTNDDVPRNDSKSWSVSRSGYSYSDPVNQIPPQDNNFDDILGRNSTSSKEDDDRIQRKNVLNSKLRMAGAPQMTSREMSARTRRAHKLNEAHMRSRGLGQHSTSNTSYIRATENDGKIKWKEKEDWF